MNIDQALGYLLRDPQSVEAEAGRVLNAEILARGQEVAQLRERLARKEPPHGSSVDMASYFDMQAQACALADAIGCVQALLAWPDGQPVDDDTMLAAIDLSAGDIRRALKGVTP